MNVCQSHKPKLMLVFHGTLRIRFCCGSNESQELRTEVFNKMSSALGTLSKIKTVRKREETGSFVAMFFEGTTQVKSNILGQSYL